MVSDSAKTWPKWHDKKWDSQNFYTGSDLSAIMIFSIFAKIEIMAIFSEAKALERYRNQFLKIKDTNLPGRNVPDKFLYQTENSQSCSRKHVAEYFRFYDLQINHSGAVPIEISSLSVSTSIAPKLPVIDVKHLFIFLVW